MAGLDPAIHVFAACAWGKNVDGRDEPGHDSVEKLSDQQLRMPGKALRPSFTAEGAAGRFRLISVSTASPLGYFSRAIPRAASQQSSLALALRSRVQASSAEAVETASRVAVMARMAFMQHQHAAGWECSS